jgi:phosphopentomutase/2,3-bisphosphoglycerate-independent phosphoglycerate mutase family metalloenzyme
MFAITLLTLSLLSKAPIPAPIFLITLDGVMWQDIYGSNGENNVPYLYFDFVEQGVAIGKLSPIISSGPCHISIPGYLELMRGHPSIDCQTNSCNPVIDRSIIDYFQQPAVFSSWHSIKKVLPKYSNLYSDTGKDYRLDIETEKAVNLYLITHQPDFLWVALGDTDEYAHANDRTDYLKALQTNDQFIHSLVEKFPSSTFIITTDHGRNANFRDHGYGEESERVWLMMRAPNVPPIGFVWLPDLTLSNIFPTILDAKFGWHYNGSILGMLNND